MNKRLIDFNHGHTQEALKKLCLPLCRSHIANIIRLLGLPHKFKNYDLKNILSYKTIMNKFLFQNNCQKIFENNITYLPTSHNTPIKTALRSCRNIN